MRRRILCACAAAGIAAAGCAAAPAAAERPPIGFEALCAFDALPRLADWPAYQDSSYHRDDINADAGNFLRVEPNGDQVLVDTDGPGVVYRVWSTGVVGMQMSKECRLRFHFDGEETPRLDLSMAELFGAEGSRWPFVPPFAETFESGVGGGEGPCNLCYVPMPFARHLKIIGRNVMFYHVDYHKLPPGTAVESFSLDLAEGNRAALEKAAAYLRNAGAPPAERPGERVREFGDVVLGPSRPFRTAFDGEGMLTSLLVKFVEPDDEALRGCVLRIAFDGRACVLVPAGDFFGSGCGDRRFKSLPCGMTDEGYYSYWPMPFRKGAVVELMSDLARDVRIARIAVGWVPGPQAPDAGYFHARYVQDPDIPLRQDYRILDVRGRGKFVGTNVSMQNARGATGIFFLEGDEKIYVDGEKYPSRWLGTGTEDYFNGAYFWNAPDKAAMARPYGGLTFLDWGIGRVCAYRWHVTDWIGFTRGILVDMEHGGVSDVPCNYQSVAYYYLEEPAPQEPLPPCAERLPKTALPAAPAFMCCALDGAPVLGGAALEQRRFSALNPRFDSSDSLWLGRGGAGDALVAKLSIPGEDDFAVHVFAAGGPAFAALDAALDGAPLGRIDARRPGLTPWFMTEFGPRRLAGGTHELRLAIAEGSGEERDVGLVAVQLKPRSPFLRAWWIIGNWPCPQDGGWAIVNEVERSQDVRAAYKLPDGSETRWRAFDGPHVDLGGAGWAAAYGLTYVWSPDERSVGCFIAKDDGLRIWLNDRVVFDRNTWSHAWHDQFSCAMPLAKGWNKVLVKCANWSGSWGFALRLGDPDGVLRCAREPIEQQ
ncbi:MAG TPA: hypothetical protein DCM87_02245 [Planctomycetes bacterium]|nr:hypothetical protein [Planctomycetota bacterium]